MTKLREQAIETLEHIKVNKVKFYELRGLV